MKRFYAILLTLPFILILSHKLCSQSYPDIQELGVTAGAFTNFPANQNYLKENIGVFYVAPYVRTGKHEFSVGLVCPLKTHALYFSDNQVNPRIGAVAGYKFYLFDMYGRENMFIHYSFQYLRFKGVYDNYFSGSNQSVQMTEINTYINNIFGLGYNLFFDTNERFGFFYTLDYVISQTGYKIGTPNSSQESWATQYVWNNICTNVGFSFKLTSLKKKEKK